MLNGQGEGMKWFLYNVIFGAAYALMLPKFIWRMIRRGGYARNFLQRIGVYSRELKEKLGAGGWIWVHAVSVGEMSVAMRVMNEMREKDGTLRFMVSTNTSTAYSLAQKKLPGQDALVYFPVDAVPVMDRVARLVKPRLLMLTECELWPNLMRVMSRRGVPAILFNGRLSDSSYKGYKAARFFFRDVVALLDVLSVQSEEDGRRLIELGAEPARVFVDGTVKYDISAVTAGGAARGDLLEGTGMGNGDLILVGGSTWPGEEDILCRAVCRLKPEFSSLKLILVPRHAERRNEVLASVQASGLSCVMKTSLEAGAGPRNPDALIVDTTGELMKFYEIADVVFVGKSLTRNGGQNFIEPAFFSKPVLVGPNLENFLAVAADFEESNALVRVKDEAGLVSELRRLLGDEAHRRVVGERAGCVVRLKSGASGRIAARAMACLSGRQR